MELFLSHGAGAAVAYLMGFAGGLATPKSAGLGVVGAGTWTFWGIISAPCTGLDCRNERSNETAGRGRIEDPKPFYADLENAVCRRMLFVTHAAKLGSDPLPPPVAPGPS
jgi:hypothetical protein